MTRPNVDELAPVRLGSLVIRLIHPTAMDPSVPRREMVKLAAFKTDDLTPSSTSYGASAFVKDLLQSGVKDLEAAEPKWAQYGYAEVPVEKLTALGIRVLLSPDDCSKYPTIKHAHASLVGLKREMRTDLLRIVTDHLIRP